MIQVRYIDAYADDCCSGTYAEGFQQMYILTLTQGINAECYHHSQDDEEVVVGHLHMVSADLQGSEECRDHQCRQIALSERQHNTTDQWRQIGQGDDFPDMSGSNDDEEIAGECPNNCTQHGQILTEVEGTKQDIEA